jgi:hypothetical protein
MEKPWREPSPTTTAVPRLHGTDLRSFEVQKRLNALFALYALYRNRIPHGLFIV